MRKALISPVGVAALGLARCGERALTGGGTGAGVGALTTPRYERRD